MSSSSSLTCNFTINSSLDIGVSFVSDDNGANYGGQITIFTPGTAGPVSTGLWDSDGNVFFTLYQSENPAINCVINSGSTPGSWDPYIEVAQQNGLTCTISGPVPQPGENTFGYTLDVVPSAGVGQGAVTARAAGSPTPQHVARMVLPAGGKEAWTLIMQGNTPVPDEISVGSPVVMAWARFDDGTQVAGGVYKSDRRRITTSSSCGCWTPTVISIPVGPSMSAITRTFSTMATCFHCPAVMRSTC